MTEFALEGVKPNDDSTDLCKRDVRALTEYQTVLHEGGDIYSVTTESGSEYRVDPRENRCTCPDKQHNLGADGECKHLRRVKFATGERPIPAWCDTEAIHDGIGEHVEDGPVFEDGEARSPTCNPQGQHDETTVEADTDTDAVEVATDGGVLTSYVDRIEDDDEANDEGEDDDDGRPDDCECDGFHRDIDLPCWPCYHDGFEEPATE